MDIAGDLYLRTRALASAERGKPYSDSIEVESGDPPCSWQVIEGSLPDGLTLNSTTGHISGITHSTTGQSAAFTVRITDSGNPPASLEREFAISVADPLEIVTETLQNGLQKSPYEAVLEANGGISPHFWTMNAGQLPDGLILNPDTGVISGAPALCGAFDLTVNVQGSAPKPDVANQAYQMDVICCDACYVISGNTMEMPGVEVHLEGDAADSATTDENGDYAFTGLSKGRYTVRAVNAGETLMPASQTITIQNRDIIGVDFGAAFQLVDVDNSGEMDLQDAILVLQIMANIDPGISINAGADINHDEKIGLEELIFILQSVAGGR